MSLSSQELQHKLEKLASQQEIMFTFIEKGLAHLSKQLNTISKNNIVNEQVIHHLQSVVRDSFNQINKQEDEIAALHHQQSQVGDWMLQMCATMDTKERRIKELEEHLLIYKQNEEQIAFSNMWIYPSEPAPNQIILPYSPRIHPCLAPNMDFDLFSL